jgi:hypothetical protein
MSDMNIKQFGSGILVILSRDAIFYGMQPCGRQEYHKVREHNFNFPTNNALPGLGAHFDH